MVPNGLFLPIRLLSVGQGKDWDMPALELYQGLTEKQLEFATAVCGGMPMALAYRKAYNTENMSDASVNAAASMMMDHPKVSVFIDGLMKDQVDKSLARNRAWVRQFIIDRSMIEAQDMGNSGQTRLKALEVLGKATGAMVEVVQVDDRRSVVDIEDELRRKLHAALGKMIDVTPIASATE